MPFTLSSLGQEPVSIFIALEWEIQGDRSQGEMSCYIPHVPSFQRNEDAMHIKPPPQMFSLKKCVMILILISMQAFSELLMAELVNLMVSRCFDLLLSKPLTIVYTDTEYQ